MRSGETDKAVSIIDDKFEKIGRKISANLKHIGNLDCDVFVVGNKLFLLEANPRFGGGYPFSHESGANVAGLYVSWLKGENANSVHLNYKANLIFSKCDRLLRIE